MPPRCAVRLAALRPGSLLTLCAVCRGCPCLNACAALCVPVPALWYYVPLDHGAVPYALAVRRVRCAYMYAI